MKETLQETVEYLKHAGFDEPEIGIILGTGLGRFLDEVEIQQEVAYSDISYFPTATVEFHSGKLVYGKLAGKNVVVMSGRFHLYEGYTPWEVTYGVRVMHQLGIKALLISNAAGAVNLSFNKGDLMVIEDHINLQGTSPLAFATVGEFGDRFADMLEPYSHEINRLLKEIAKKHKITLREGTYAGVLGPQLETRAEYRMLQILEVDAVGMSTVPEVIVATHLNVPCAAISVITDECDPKHLAPIDIQEIIQIAGKAEPKMILLFKELVKII